MPVVKVWDSATSSWAEASGTGGGAPTDATYVVTSANGALSNERVLTGGGSTYITLTDNGSSTVTVAVDATSANTASKVVARDSSGNFSAGTITAALTGTASGNIANTLADAKGDLIVASGADAFSILGVGASGAYLVADSDATNGVAWGGMYPVTSDVTVANSTTFATATGMSASLAASKKYLIRGAVLFDTTAQGDFKFQFTGPASPTMVRILNITNVPGATSLGSVVHTAFSTSSSITGTGTTGGAVQFSGVVQTSAGNSGTLAFQFAQASAQNDSGAIVRAGSYLEVIRVG